MTENLPDPEDFATEAANAPVPVEIIPPHVGVKKSHIETPLEDDFLKALEEGEKKTQREIEPDPGN